jgi:hypothetical protein
MLEGAKVAVVVGGNRIGEKIGRVLRLLLGWNKLYNNNYFSSSQQSRRPEGTTSDKSHS